MRLASCGVEQVCYILGIDTEKHDVVHLVPCVSTSSFDRIRPVRFHLRQGVRKPVRPELSGDRVLSEIGEDSESSLDYSSYGKLQIAAAALVKKSSDSGPKNGKADRLL